MQRGVIRHREYAAQIRNFSGLKYKNITPTDLDGLIEYQNECFIFLEAKFEGSDLPQGQRLALVRLCDAVQKSKPAILFVSEHNTRGDIDFASTRVKEFYFCGKWRKFTKETLLKEAVDRFLEKYGKSASV